MFIPVARSSTNTTMAPHTTRLAVKISILAVHKSRSSWSWYDTGSDKWRFTSYERDAESGNDYAMARFDVNRLGRFSSADPLSGFLSDPQSLNHYPYAGNDPINLIDPTGRDDGFYEDPNCDVHITNVNPLCPTETDCAGEVGCGSNGDAGGGTSGGGAGGLGPLDPAAEPGCRKYVHMELGSFPNPGYDNLNIYVYTNDVNNQPDTISGDIFIKPMPFAVPGPKLFGST